jgi:hypothetical protein
VCESTLAQGEPSLKRKCGPYYENRARQEQLTQEAESLREEQSKLRNELKELGADKSHQRRVRELERGIRRAEDELVEASRRLGELFRANPVRSFAADPEVKNRLRRAALAEKSSEKYRKRIRRLEAAMLIDALDGQVRAMREKIEKVTREIRAREQEVRELEGRISASEGERERLVKVRGPLQDLLELEEPGGDRE